ncbi:hypothetical protein RJC98_06655 [Pseudomonas allii]|uniref:Uncharacterized protein n=1 Tax=Pseudomonas allii TaxID=2740531 RepID=A0ACC6L9J6_9PSED|nr:DUF6543 domain-containing protein [Pseudomonas allii]MDR9874851.1 hypothetical protein [Pseudomonas allii]
MSKNAHNNNNHTLNGRPTNAYELLTQLTTGPSAREVASFTLRWVLKEQYPTLNIDPDLTMIVTPRWRVLESVIMPLPPHAESITTVLARQMLSPTPVIYLEGEHFLTLHPESPAAVHLPVKVDAIARLINELGGLLFAAFQERQLDYWNASNGSSWPRWQTFSHSLRKSWNVTTVEDWDVLECDMARELYQFPLRAQRRVNGRYNSRAYVVDASLLRDGFTVHVGILDMAVLIGEHNERTMILAYSLVSGYERFGSLEELGKALPAKLVQLQPGTTLQWKLYEPADSFFDSFACALIAMQIQAIGEAEQLVDESSAPQPVTPTTLSRIVPNIENLSDHALSHIRQIHQQMPAWLANASDQDIAIYSRYIIELAQIHSFNQGHSFQDGIPPIRDYALQKLQEQIRTHKEGEHLNLNKVAVTIESPVIWGTFAIPGEVDVTRHNLIDLALENLTGLPTGQPTVYYNGSVAPQWLSFSYLKEVIGKIDIGKYYPALIKSTLLDEPIRSRARQLLYISHLRVQLPLLALQLKIQQRQGMDELGYRYVAAVMQVEKHDQQVDGQPIVIRPLAFVPTLRSGTQRDEVANMFVIGPRDPSAGPCVLYRPLLEPVLAQFPSRQNLVYMIKQDPDLRESVLSWLPEKVRFNYEQYVFPDTLPSPWTVVRVIVEPATVVDMSGPIELSDDVLGDGALITLFKANANAMVELATRQSISNEQKRWATFRQTGWQIFNAVLPFLGPTVGVAAWMWQIMEDLEQAEQAVDKPDKSEGWNAIVDLWLNLGMALALHVGLRHPTREPVIEPTQPRLEPIPEKPIKPEDPLPQTLVVANKQLPDLPGTDLTPLHQETLHISGALSRAPSSLGTRLDTFKTDKPATLGEQNRTPGVHLHLYPDKDKWYAPVGERWFEVSLDDNDNVVIADPSDPARTGPLLVSNRSGQWFVDVRLRLRGGGFRSRRRAAQGQKPQRITELRKSLTDFDANESRRQAELSDSLAAIGSEPGPSTARRRDAYIGDVDRRLEEYDVPIRQLTALGVIDTVPNYQIAMVDYLNKQLLLTRSAVEERLRPYRDTLLDTVGLLDEATSEIPQSTADLAQEMSTLNLEMISRLEYVDSRYKELSKLGTAGAQVMQTTSKALPNLNLHDLKALQVTVSRFLCIKNGNATEQLQARAQLNTIVEKADLAVQSYLETLQNETDSPLAERIEVLDSLVDQFTSVDQRLLDLHTDAPEQVLREPLNDLLRLVDEFNQRATHDLARLLRERKALEPKPGPSRPLSAAPRKVIKTRFHGVVVGEPRESDPSLVDVKAPLTGNVIATFHEKTPGQWAERVKEPARPPASKPISLDTSLKEGQTLLDAIPATIKRLEGHANKPWRLPADIEGMFHLEVPPLERAVETLEEALTQRNLTEIDHPAAAQLKLKLNAAVQQLYEKGKATRIKMIKEQVPVAHRIQWLYEQGEVGFRKTLTRRRLQRHRDFLDEYEVFDHKTRAVLWYAHFHYRSMQAGNADFVAGHFKTVAQQKLGGAFQATGLSDKEQIAIERAAIGKPLAGLMFFNT